MVVRNELMSVCEVLTECLGHSVSTYQLKPPPGYKHLATLQIKE